jgi:glycosyltransferase involved in cell wall biosynthesis
MAGQSLRRFSIVIPYHRRLPYIEQVLRSLAEQDIPLGDVEVIVVSMEYSEPLLRVLSGLPEELRVRCVMAREPWNVSRARNIGIRNAAGRTLLLLDADMLLPRSFLRRLRDEYDPAGRPVAVIGQMLNYDAYTDVPEASLAPYEHYRATYLAGNTREGLRGDARWHSTRSIPWSLYWTALIAIPRELVMRHSLYFDEGFRGWGAEDLEWGYRLQRCGIMPEFADGLWGIHLPHPRDVRKNCAEQELNYERFIRKWPCFEVEIVSRFGDAFAREHFGELTAARRRVCGSAESVNVLEMSAGNSRLLAVGAICDRNGEWLNRPVVAGAPQAEVTRSTPLLGLRLPYRSKDVDTGYVLPSVRNAPPPVLTLIQQEVERVSKQTVLL